MFNKNKVISALTGLVGWDQPLDPALPVLDTGNLTSDSGFKFDENPFVKIQSLKNAQDYPAITDEQFNTYLDKLQGTSISNVVTSVFDKPDYIDRQVLYPYANNKITTETLPDGFVGYEIEVSNEKNLAFELKRVILEFEGAGDIKLLLFNSAKSTPIQSKVVTIASSLQEETLDWRVDNTETFYKGKFYFGYITTGLTVSPYKRDYQNSNVQSNIKETCFRNIKVSHTTETLFDLTSIESASESWGLNPDIVVYDDYTDFIVQNKSLFAKAIQMQGQIESISVILAASRSNPDERYSQEAVNKMIVELDGIDTDVKVTGLRQKLYGELGRIRKEIKKLKKGFLAYGFIVNTRE